MTPEPTLTEAQVADQLADAPWHQWLQPWAFASDPSLLEVAARAVRGLAAASQPAAVVRLHDLGQQARDRERGAWDRADYRAQPDHDGAVAEMWTRWATGQPWSDQAAWRSLLSKPVRGSFRQALSNRPLPPDVVRRALTDLDEALFYQLIGSASGASGFAELAVTVLETGAGGPVRSLMGALSDREHGLVATCVARRGHWPGTLAQALPDLPGPAERALHLRQATTAEHGEAWLDLHVVLRLVATWAESGVDDGPARDRSILVQNRGRARGRLRAVAMRRAPSDLLVPLLALDALADRTRAAARRWAWGWAWEALATGFAFDLGQPVIRPCAHDAATPDPLGAEEREAVWVWALLVALRGRWTTLASWSRTGQGDADGTWGRLLGEVPPHLRDPDGGLSRVRSALAAESETLGPRLAPVLEALAALPEGRRLKQAFWEVLDPVWNDAIRRPKAGFPSMRREAVAWVHASEAGGSVPEPTEQEPEP